MNKRFPFPKRYWIYLGALFTCAVLLFANIFRTNAWMGDKPFSEYVQKEWVLAGVFLIEELIIAFFMVLFSVLAGRISIKRNQKIVADWEQNKFMGIQPDDYDYVWFDFSCTERALVLKQNNVYKLYIHEYDKHRGVWQALDSVSIYDSLAELKKALFFDFDFYCDENAKLDEHGDEEFKE